MTRHKHTNRNLRSRAGRRAGQESGRNREAILDAARQCFARDGFRATTMRSIAAEAGVTPAMLHYHFGNKSGLYFAVIESVAEPLLRELGEMRKEPGSGNRLADFIALYMRTIAAHPEIPSLLMHDVLSAEGSMRATFASRFASRGREAMSGLLRAAQREGDIDDTLDLDLGVISMLSLAIFPFLAAPLIREVFGIEWNDERLADLIEHQQNILLQGIRNSSQDGAGT